MQSRLVFNALVHQYLIAWCADWFKGAGGQTSRAALGNIFSAARLVLPSRGGGCLLCNELIPAAKLQEEAAKPRRTTAATLRR